MNKSMIAVWLALASVIFTTNAQAEDLYAETVTLSSSSAAQATLKYGGRQIALSCDGEVRYKMCNDSACANGGVATTTDARLTNFDLPVDLCMPANKNYLSLIRTGSSTVTCYVYRVDPKTICK
jgi:hypothetical protein